MSDERVLSALRALAESDGELEGSAELENRLRHAFRRRRWFRAWRSRVSWAATAATIAAVFWVSGKAGKNAGLQAELPVPETPIVSLPERAEAKAAPIRKKLRVRNVQAREVVTEFFPLMDVAPPFERGELLRVNLAAGAMRVVGLPVDEDRLTDRVQADVLIGQEGLPRAIRFVRNVQ